MNGLATLVETGRKSCEVNNPVADWWGSFQGWQRIKRSSKVLWETLDVTIIAKGKVWKDFRQVI